MSDCNKCVSNPRIPEVQAYPRFRNAFLAVNIESHAHLCACACGAGHAKWLRVQAGPWQRTGPWHALLL